MTYAILRPIRSPILLLTRMNAADTSASRAIALWTPLAVVPKSVTTAEIDTFISDVSTTSTNIAIAKSSPRRMSPWDSASAAGAWVAAVAVAIVLVVSLTHRTRAGRRTRKRGRYRLAAAGDVTPAG